MRITFVHNSMVVATHDQILHSKHGRPRDLLFSTFVALFRTHTCPPANPLAGALALAFAFFLPRIVQTDEEPVKVTLRARFARPLTEPSPVR